MQTIYDWTAMVIFCVVAVLFLSRSIGSAIAGDKALNYLPPALGCAAANYLGNKEYHVVAVLLMFATIFYIVAILKPFPKRSDP